MAKKKKASSPKLMGADVRELPESARNQILGGCANLKEPDRSKCIKQHSRAFREKWTRKKHKAIRKGSVV
jgi:hypothetical protein|tara:strand:+ start:215 stop:424 length:210 start_codon:yes stop_codon:yes gene_type:complete